MTRTRLVWLALSLTMACAGGFCGGAEQLAELTTHSGDVQRDESNQVGRWRDVQARARFFVGDGLRTGPNGRAQLSLSSDAVALVEANTILRFLDRDPRGGDGRLSVEEGSLELESGALSLDVAIPRALARLERGARVRIMAGPRGVALDVLVGRVTLDQEGSERALSAGEKLELSPLGAAPSSRTSDAAPTLADAAPADTEDEANAAAARVHTAEPSGDVDLQLTSLAPLTIHAPSLPVTLQVAAQPCEAGAQLEIDGQKTRGQPALTVRLGAGTHRLRLRCGRKLLESGSVRVLRDAATAELPHSAQRIDIDADGRRYTVKYQNVLPVVSVRWSRARSAPKYELVLRRGKRERSFRLTQPRFQIPASELAEGNYEFWFEGEGGQRSETGALRIEFDNTARSLTLTEPKEGAAAGSVTPVSGVALLRSAVSANGVPLALDDKGRFRAQIPLDGRARLVVIAAHPSAGLHYYLRRLD